MNPPADRRATRRAWLSQAGALGLAAAGLPAIAVAQPAAGAKPAPASEGPTALERIRQRGSLVVAIYQDLPPFHQNGKGIEVDLAQALARSLGVGLSLMPFNADEEMSSDLRNMVWKGHYLGFGPADVLLHVPVDRPLMDATPQALIFGPYYRETVAIARRLDQVPTLDSLAPLASQRTAVPGQSLAGWLLIGADGGAYRERLSTRWKDGTDAARALKSGEVTVAAGLRSELESVLSNDPAFEIGPLPSPRAPRDGWAVGCAVKRSATDLAAELQKGLDSIANAEGLGRMFEQAGVRWRRA